MVDMTEFPIGAAVRLRSKPDAGVATIRNHYEFPGGVRVEPPLDGFVSWNVQELEPVSPVAE